MPPICTPEKYNNIHCNNIVNSNLLLEFVTPPLNTKNNLIKKNDIKYINKIRQECPTLFNIFDIQKKIGEGTFSTVFLATLNDAGASDKLFAIKYLVPTTHPKRIEVELHCLKQIGGRDNVAGLDLCIREKDNIVFIMPYLQHDPFGDYVKDMDSKEIALYIKNLLKALSRVHSFGIIHRDVKPNNFLYDRQNKKFLLIDFGLAQLCSTSQSTHNYKRKREPEEKDVEAKLKSGPPAKRQALQSRNLNNLSSVITHLQRYQETNKSSCKENISSVADAFQPNVQESLFKSPLKINTKFNVKKSPFKFPGLDLPATHTTMVEKKNHQRKLFEQDNQSNVKPKLNKVKFNVLANERNVFNNSPAPTLDLKRETKDKHLCTCYGRAKICTICIVRKAQDASRAGTPGFRPPEVLLKYDRQTTAVDLWAVGVIMLSLLSRSYPFFQAPDDVSALAEIITLFGDEQIKKLAKMFGQDLIFSEKKPKLDIRKVCCRLRARGKTPNNISTLRCVRCAGSCVCPDAPMDDVEDVFPASAYDLLKRLLDVNPSTRITAEQALNHEFLRNS